jgi:hypothetical protein
MKLTGLRLINIFMYNQYTISLLVSLIGSRDIVLSEEIWLPMKREEALAILPIVASCSS